MDLPLFVAPDETATREKLEAAVSSADASRLAHFNVLWNQMVQSFLKILQRKPTAQERRRLMASAWAAVHAERDLEEVLPRGIRHRRGGFMPIVSISLDTSTRAVVMTIDGVQVPAQDVSLYKCRYTSYDGTEREEVGFSYTMRQKGANGLEETVSYRLPYPDPDESSDASQRDARGFIVEQAVDQAKATNDIAAFLASRVHKVGSEEQPATQADIQEAIEAAKKSADRCRCRVGTD